MKQLTKLGSQGARVLTQDQMKNIQGGIQIGNMVGCRGAQSGKQCSTLEACAMMGLDGILLTGNCTVDCRCNITGKYDPEIKAEDPVLP